MARRKTTKPSNLHRKTISVKTAIAAIVHRVPRFIAVLCLCLCSVGIVGLIYFSQQSDNPVPASAAVKPEALPPSGHEDYVGTAACMSCHPSEFKAWQGSHHDLAMQEANAQTLLGDFDNAVFKHHGVESTFFKRGGKPFVRTDGPGGKLADYEIKYTFGFTPLQQYLIAFPGGRLQALSIAWDSRSKAEGGQRWFHLYPHEKIDYTDQLHWTGRYQNWNLECAECHSTHLKKGYDAATDSYKTTFSDLNVGCEACHGPASRHVEWAKRAQPPYVGNSDKGLMVHLQSRWREAWTFPASDAKFARRDQPAADTLMNSCWTCHALSSALNEGGLPGLPLEDTHRPALLTPPAYHADGQQRDEDYTWGSFRQSKMYQKGVTCLDCHEPHALTLRAEGNALCARCHNAAEFDNTKHHFHKPGSKGAQCIDCHAPKQNYMIIDGRRDHSFRRPRPDLSRSLGSPNACTQCHQNRKPEWAAAVLDKRYGKSWRQPHYGTVLHAGATQGAKALPALFDLAQNPASPGVVRATAVTLAEPLMRAEFLPAARLLLQDADPSVRIAALGLMETFEPDVRASAATPLLSDPLFGVRLEAGRVLADVPANLIPSDKQGALDSALQDYLDSLLRSADWPAANINLGNLKLRQGDSEAAIAAYQKALTLDPRFAGAYVNLADVYRQLNREQEGEQLLRRGLSLLPRSADLHHAFGLLAARKGDESAARRELARAVELAPDNARYAYVYAVALHSVGKRREALAVLKAADNRRPYDLDVLETLIAIQREAGNTKDALVYARKAAEVMPDNAGIKRLVEELEDAK